MSKGGATQLRATARSSSSPATRALAGKAMPAARASMATAPMPRTYDVLPPCTAALALRARIASHARASPAKTEPCRRSDCGWRTPTRMAPDEDGGHAEDGEHRGQPRPAHGQVGEAEADETGEQPGQPRQHQQRTVAVDRRQGGEEVLPPEHRLVGHASQRRGAGQHRGVADRAQAQRATEQEEEDHHDGDRRDDRPAGRPRQVRDADSEHHAEHPHDEVGGAGERGAQRAQGDRRRAPR